VELRQRVVQAVRYRQRPAFDGECSHVTHPLCAHVDEVWARKKCGSRYQTVYPDPGFPAQDSHKEPNEGVPGARSASLATQTVGHMAGIAIRASGTARVTGFFPELATQLGEV
jgi:hypothetical protein